MPTTNTLGTLAETGVFHDALRLTLKRLPFIKNIASDIAPVMADQMIPFNVQQILKNWNSALAVAYRDQTNTYAKQAGVNAQPDQYFTLTQWPYISIQLTLPEINAMVDSAKKQDARNIVIGKLMKKAFNLLGTTIANRLYAVLSGATIPTVFQSTVGNMTYQQMGSIVDQLLLNDALDAAPDAILEVVCYREMVNSLTAVPNASYNISEMMEGGAVSEGVSGARSVTRFNLTQATNANRGMLFGDGGVVFANRIPMEEEIANDPVFQTVITEPDTGFSVLLREAKDPLTGEVTRTITTMFDFALGLVQKLVRINTSGV